MIINEYIIYKFIFIFILYMEIDYVFEKIKTKIKIKSPLDYRRYQNIKKEFNEMNKSENEICLCVLCNLTNINISDNFFDIYFTETSNFWFGRKKLFLNEIVNLCCKCFDDINVDFSKFKIIIIFPDIGKFKIKYWFKNN